MSFYKYPTRKWHVLLYGSEIISENIGVTNYTVYLFSVISVNKILPDIMNSCGIFGSKNSFPDQQWIYPNKGFSNHKNLSDFQQLPAPWYEEILLPMDFGRLSLQSYCDDPYCPILMIYSAYERRGMELVTVGRDKSFTYAYTLKNLRKIWKYSKNALWHHFENPY